MKQSYIHLVIVAILIWMTSSCAKDEVVPSIEASTTSTTVGYRADNTQTFTFTSSTDWSISVADAEIISVSPLSGKGGSQTVTIKANSSNETNEVISTSFSITSQDVVKHVTVTQNPAFHLEQTAYEMDAQGGELHINVSTDVDVSGGVLYAANDAFKEMAGLTTATTRSYENNGSIAFTISPNKTSQTRVGYLRLADSQENGVHSETITVIQAAEGVEVSSDYTSDGTVKRLHTHTSGNGIPIILMGDAFIDTDIADGTYEAAMEKAEEYFFSIEPTKSLKQYYDIYAVTAVSKNNITGSNYNTVFSTKFSSSGSTEITGDDDTCYDYAVKAVGKSNMTNALIIVVINDTRYAGTCYMYSDGKNAEIPVGYSIAYVPMTDGTKYEGVGFEQILHHEAIGHGFGKLTDEYYYEANGAITAQENETLLEWQGYGCFRNVDTHNKVADTYWSRLAADIRYSSEKLSVYEGGYTYTSGVYRPTQTSIMNDNTNTFNAPSREAIYKRTLYLANNKNWSYDYETFVAFDEVSRTAAAYTRNTTPAKSIFAKPLAQPHLKIMQKR